jgi:microcystin-dependent protein
MPSDSNGVYSLPPGYLAADGTTITITQHNAPLEDLASSMTARLMRSGVAPMTGPLQLADGSRAEPSLTLASSPLNGLYAHSSGAMAMVGVVGATPVGSVMDFAGTAAPTAWLLCYGQAVSRTTYAVLFSVIGEIYGVGDGSTTFNVPDLRGRVPAGKDDMGGTSANRLTNADDGLNGDTLGATGGGETQALAITNLAAHSHAGTTDNGGVDHTHSVPDGADQYDITPDGGAANVAGNNGQTTGGASAFLHTHTFTTDSKGSGTPFGIVQPTIIFNKIIYTGV